MTDWGFVSATHLALKECFHCCVIHLDGGLHQLLMPLLCLILQVCRDLAHIKVGAQLLQKSAASDT